MDFAECNPYNSFFAGFKTKKKEIFFRKIERSILLVIIGPNYDSEGAIFFLRSVVYYL
jgi:hypothetical protein